MYPSSQMYHVPKEFSGPERANETQLWLRGMSLVSGVRQSDLTQVFNPNCKIARTRKRRTKKKKKKRGVAAGLAALEANGESMELGEDEKPPLNVFFDTEAIQDTRRHVPTLVVVETEDDDRDTLKENDTRSLTVVAYSFQGYDAISWSTNIASNILLWNKYAMEVN